MRSSGSPVRMSWPRRTAQITRWALTMSEVLVCASRRPTGRPSSRAWIVTILRNAERWAWREPFSHTWATMGCVVCSLVADRFAAARKVWADRSTRSMEIRKPASRITDRIGRPSQRWRRLRLDLPRHPTRLGTSGGHLLFGGPRRGDEALGPWCCPEFGQHQRTLQFSVS